MLDQIEKWQELSREVIFEKYNRKLECVKYTTPDGKINDFYIKNERAAVGVVALTEDKRVILVRQFRPGPQEILDELPGGYIEDGETPEAAAARELLEETGYQGTAKLAATAVDCAYATTKKHCVVVTGCVKISEPHLENTEFAETVLVSLKDFRALLRSGKNTDVELGYLGLDFLGLL